MATITEDYVSDEIFKLLKEKGFDDSCCRFVVESDETYHRGAPTLQMAMKWLREIHDIDFDINTTGSRHVRRYHLAIWENKDEEMVTINPIGYFNKWEQACEAAIKYCLEHLI